MVFSRDEHHVIITVFIQHGSDISCLLTMNVLPLLGLRFLRENGVALHTSPNVAHTTKETSTAPLNAKCLVKSRSCELKEGQNSYEQIRYS